jgi:hypothetical protein
MIPSKAEWRYRDGRTGYESLQMTALKKTTSNRVFQCPLPAVDNGTAPNNKIAWSRRKHCRQKIEQD